MRSQGGGILVKFLAFFVVLCFERCCPKQNNAARWKSKYLVPKNFGLVMLPPAGLF